MTQHKHYTRFFKDSDGRIVIWQWPNTPLYGWLIARIVSIPINNTQVDLGLQSLSSAFLFVWAYLEITKGVTYFRRLLGVVVLALVVFHYFQ